MPAGPKRVAVVIEDDADIRNLLEAILDQAGFTCFAAASGAEGILAVREHQPILTTLDISLPGIDGFEVARQIRSFSTTYIIMLSARDEEIDTLMGLDAGADDYLTKPFRPRELRARIEAMLRRYHVPEAGVDTEENTHAGSAGAGAAKPPLPAGASASGGPSVPQSGGQQVGGQQVGSQRPAGGQTLVDDGDEADGWLSHNGLRINPDMWLVELNGNAVELTRSEFDLMLAIMSGRRRVISKDTLALELRGDYSTGGYVSDSDRRAVEVHMANLRRKLNDPVSSPRYIETVRGVGYRLADRQR